MNIRHLLSSTVLATLCLTASAQTPTDLRFGVEAGYAPFAVKATDGKLKGFDIDLGEAICQQLKRNCVWVESSFDGMIPALKTRRFDGILSAMSVTDKRLAEINFSDRLWATPPRLIALRSSGLSATADSLKGKRVGVQSGSTHEQFANERWRSVGVQVVAYKGQNEIYQDMINGRLDATLTNAVDANENLLQKPEGKAFGVMPGEVVHAAIYNNRGTAVGLRKDDEALRADLNKAIAVIKTNGTYKRLMASYFSFDISGDQ